MNAAVSIILNHRPWPSFALNVPLFCMATKIVSIILKMVDAPSAFGMDDHPII